MSPDGRDGPTLPGLLGALAVVACLAFGLSVVWLIDPLGIADNVVRWFG